MYDNYALFENYPNPFSPVADIRFRVPKHSKVKIIVYDVVGIERAEVLNKALKPGTYEVKFNAEHLPSGEYFIRMESEDFADQIRIVLLK